MADTIRTKSDLLALLADNESGDISPQDVRDMLVTVHGVYGHMYVHDGSASQTFTTGGTAYKLTSFTANGLSNGTTVDHTSDSITVLTAGIYLVFGQFSFNGTANAIFQFHLRKNAVEVPEIALQQKLNSTGNRVSTSFVGLQSCAANDIFTVYGEAVSNSKSITMFAAQLVVFRVS